ncbi:MAG: hypothetical protein NZ937_09520, partial [Armatimonadetes bacterium]|nr:hypothetical protein [Armatimonadota bacterium]
MQKEVFKKEGSIALYGRWLLKKLPSETSPDATDQGRCSVAPRGRQVLENSPKIPTIPRLMATKTKHADFSVARCELRVEFSLTH